MHATQHTHATHNTQHIQPHIITHPHTPHTTPHTHNTTPPITLLLFVDWGVVFGCGTTSNVNAPSSTGNPYPVTEHPFAVDGTSLKGKNCVVCIFTRFDRIKQHHNTFAWCWSCLQAGYQSHYAVVRPDGDEWSSNYVPSEINHLGRKVYDEFVVFQVWKLSPNTNSSSRSILIN